MTNEKLVFANEITPKKATSKSNWKILIADDDKEVHAMTNIILRDVIFENKGLEFIYAYSGSQTISILEKDPTIEIVILDVVMEFDDSGLQVVKYIREILKNNMIRIILRTGQPGFAPEESVIIDYDINDYKEKTELSSQKLKTSIISALRSYNYISTIVDLNKNLEKKVEERTKDLQKANDELTRSLRIIHEDEAAGRKTQFKLLPSKKKKIHGYEFTNKLIPSLYLSGDFLDYFEINDTYTGFYFADVAGHGASSAFITVVLKSFIDKWLEKYREENDPTILKPNLVLHKLNQLLICENLGKHLTLFYGIIHKNENILYYANGGQYPFPILLTHKRVNEIECCSFPIGLFDFVGYEKKKLLLPDEFLLLFVSDGILEILHQEELSEKKEFLLSKIVSLEDSISSILERITMSKSFNNPDDITFLMIKRKIDDYKNEN